MKMFAVNGSPRLTNNTATVLRHALDGARAAGFETEMVHLYKLRFTGCKSCFACKLLHGEFHGRCCLSDDLAPVLESLKEADAIIFGTPIYLFNISSGMSAFLERFLFPHIMYDKDCYTQYPKKLPHAFIFTMNDTVEGMKAHGVPDYLAGVQKHPAMIFQTPTNTLYVNNTYQFSDYSKYESSAFNEEDKRNYLKEIFPIDCQKAFDLGRSLAEAAIELNS